MSIMTFRPDAGQTDGSTEDLQPGADAAWQQLAEIRVNPRRLARRRIIAAARLDPAHVAFDLLRTRLLQALKERGWSRVAITSPTQGCGKTFVAANLAFSLSRRPSCRTLLIDMDLRIPNLAGVLGVRDPGSMLDFLTGRRPVEAHVQRIAANLAVALNSAPIADSAELIQEPVTSRRLDAVQAILCPDVVLYDLPPALACDDVIAFLPQIDGILLVAGGGKTTADEVRQCERLLTKQTPLLGVILNKAEDPAIRPYYA